MPPTLYLIDGHALAYRTYFALTAGAPGRFSTSQGEPTAGVYGFTSVLLRILEQERPDYLAVAFDVGRTFRDDMYPEYKATREKMPEDLGPQIERIRQLLDAFNIPRVEVEGYEADDVLGSLANRIVDQGLGVKIITGDRDLLQLVEDRIIVNLPGKSLSEAQDYLPEDVEEYIGVGPDKIVDFKALTGDKSDNIPGVRGIGKKTATSLLEKYQDLDEIYAHLDELSPGVHKKLEEQREEAYLSRQLAKIVIDLDVSIDLDQARTDRFEPGKVEAIFRELEFRSLLPRLNSVIELYGKHTPAGVSQLTFFGEGTATEEEKDQAEEEGKLITKVIDTPESLEALASLLHSAQWIAFDTETTSTDQMQAALVGISLAIDEKVGYYIPVGHQEGLGDQLPLDQVIKTLRDPLTDANIRKVGHNLKYDYVVLSRHGLDVSPLSFDTMIAEWLINPTSRNLGLKNLAWVRLNFRMTDIEELIGKGRNQITMAEVPISKAAAYAGADAAITLQLMPILQAELEDHKAGWLFRDVEMPLVKVLADMEMAGIVLDTDFLKEMSQSLEERLGAIESKIFQRAGTSFNLNSPQQLSEILFERLEIQPPDRTQRTASGYFSTAASVLELLQKEHEIVAWVLEFRELSKLKSTYVDALPQQVHPDTGRLHTSYNQTGTVTGRIASSEPNLQNIPIRTEIGREVRKAFVAEAGWKLLAVDYSQVELRIVAHIAQDQAMLEAFQADQDIHTTTAAAIYDIPLDRVSKEQRRHAKAINFGLIYGMSPYGLTRATDLTLAEAEDFVEAYFHKFPGVKRYLDGARKQAVDQEYVETLLGRRRYFPGLSTQRNRNIRLREEREAVNAPIQGTAADILKIAMLQVAETLGNEGLSSRMLLQVHDELVLECPEGEIDQVTRLTQDVMEKAYSLKIPLKTDARVGENWGELESVG